MASQVHALSALFMDRTEQAGQNSDPTDPEQDLVQLAIAGDEEALEELLADRHEQILRHIERQITPATRKQTSAEDILQLTYLQVFRSIGSFEPRGPGSFSGWLKTIATNKLIDATRRRERQRVVSGKTLHADPAKSGFGDLAAAVASEGPGPRSLVMAEELRGAFHVALAELPDNYRSAVTLRYLENRSLEEVAEELGVTEGAARGICHRARQALREQILRLSRYV